MKVIVIVAHPSEDSFNHAIANAAVEALLDLGHEVVYHDLYREHFDPVLPGGEIPGEADVAPGIQGHCEELKSSGGIIIVHPNWWGQPPAILKGWIDRVIRPGVAYRFLEGDGGEGVPVGLLTGMTALVFNTSNTPEQRELSVFGDPLEQLWKKCIFELCGCSAFYRRMFSVVITSSADERRNWLMETRDIVKKYFS